VRTYPWLKMAVAAWLAPALASLICSAQPALAEGVAPAGSWMQDRDLAEMYAPVLYFHPDELFRPQPVDVLIGTARLQRERSFWPDLRLLLHVTTSDLLRYVDSRCYLNAWLGDEASSDYKSYSAHRAFYQSTLSPDAGGPSMVAYAHVVRDEDLQQITIQYWLFYWYNDAFNKHEGDWEMVQVILTAAGEPEWLVLSQHHGGTRRPWSAAQIEEGTHPVAYVALGSHANYFWGDEVYLASVTIGNARVQVADRTGTVGRVVPDTVPIPDREEIEQDPGRWAGLEWLLFRGRWGERAPQGDFSGPLGPADKGDQWERPYQWGMAQPIDTDTWYANRLRVEISGQAGGSAQVSLRGASVDELTADEALGGLALLHTDPMSGTAILANIVASPGQRYDIVATWPDAGASQVIEYRFEDVSLGAVGRATLALRADMLPLLTVAGTSWRDRLALTGSTAARRWPTAMGSTAASWNAPDVIWALGLLPGSDVLRGVALSLLAGLLPPLVYVAVLYWVDQYEKEPVRLLAAAFLWGAIPALLATVAVRIFFQLPPSLLGPGVVQLLTSGVVTPLIEEALVGAAVLFIAWRHRREFDDVLDGIIYGTVAGLGFAMAASTKSYLEVFLQYGFAGLGHQVLVEGFLYGLNQALYAAVFGAGLGYARLAQPRWQRWAVPLAAFVLAVATQAFHNLAIDNTTGWNLQTLVLTWAGFLVLLAVAVWSLRQQRHCLAVELAGEVPDALYSQLTKPGAFWLAEWRALWRGGPRGLLRVRRALQCCSRLAFKEMQSRQLGEAKAAGAVPELRQEVVQVVDGALLRLVA
jgi:RsiW-degrading membrane proteinase PrsW (M82 family)